MNPNVYLAYLCLIDNNGEIKQAFDNWRKALRSTGGWDIYEARLERELGAVCLTQMSKYRRSHIFEAEQAWKEINVKTFILFLEGFGFKK